VSVTGWTAVPAGFAVAARRYVDQVTLSLRPATVRHNPADRKAAQPGQREERPHQPALLLRPDRRMGPGRAGPAARVHPGTSPSSTSRCPASSTTLQAARLLRAARADPDPLARLIVELLARTGIRRDGVTDLDHFRAQRRDRAGSVIHEYRLVE
jgi:integrase/recombinase XerD